MTDRSVPSAEDIVTMKVWGKSSLRWRKPRKAPLYLKWKPGILPSQTSHWLMLWHPRFFLIKAARPGTCPREVNGSNDALTRNQKSTRLMRYQSNCMGQYLPCPKLHFWNQFLVRVLTRYNSQIIKNSLAGYVNDARDQEQWFEPVIPQYIKNVKYFNIGDFKVNAARIPRKRPEPSFSYPTLLKQMKSQMTHICKVQANDEKHKSKWNLGVVGQPEISSIDSGGLKKARTANLGIYRTISPLESKTWLVYLVPYLERIRVKY